MLLDANRHEFNWLGALSTRYLLQYMVQYIQGVFFCSPP